MKWQALFKSIEKSTAFRSIENKDFQLPVQRVADHSVPVVDCEEC